MNVKRTLAVGTALVIAVGAYADFDITLNLGKDMKVLKDARTSRCGPMIGYAGCTWGDGMEKYWFADHEAETAKMLKDAGAWHQRMWSAAGWFERRKPNPHDPNSKDPKVVNAYKSYKQSDPDAAFKFWKKHGFKIMFTIEAWGGDAAFQKIHDFVKYIVDNDYKNVVAGFELGNESYYAKPEQMIPLCKTWEKVIDDIWAMWPKAPMGIPICELFENNPDLTQVRNRLLAAGEIKRDTYFAAAYFNQTSAQMILCLSNKLDKISHVIYHAYGAETPYSCSYYGFQRFRNMEAAFPEIKGKKYWLTEIRPRSDEDNRCQRMFRESLIMGHYSLMAICQPEMDGFNHHQIYALSGGLYQSFGKRWAIQWRDGGGEYPDRRNPLNEPRMDLGGMGVVYSILAEGILDHPLVIAHGTSKEQDKEDTFFTSARVCDQVYVRRRALKEGKKKSGLVNAAPTVEGECEWTALVDANKSELCLLMTNSSQERHTIRVKIPGKQFAAASYRTVSCPEKYLDCREIPGEAKPWKELAYEDTQWGYETVPMEKYEGMKPECDWIDIEIEPNTVQSVTVCLRNTPKK